MYERPQCDNIRKAPSPCVVCVGNGQEKMRQIKSMMILSALPFFILIVNMLGKLEKIT